MTDKLWLLTGVIALFISIQSCQQNNIGMAGDEELFRETQEDGYTYFANGDILEAAGSSPHGRLKLRYNALVKNALDESENVPSGTSLPTGSVIVKEIYSSTGDIQLYAVMKKEPGHTHAAEGWLWAEYELDGSPYIGIAQKGSACTSCHGSSPNSDFTKSFDLR